MKTITTAINSATATPRFPIVVATLHTVAKLNVNDRPMIVVTISAGQVDERKRVCEICEEKSIELRLADAAGLLTLPESVPAIAAAPTVDKTVSVGTRAHFSC
jgi:hypothetical protein